MQGGEKCNETTPKNVVTSAKNYIILFTLPGSYFHIEYLQLLLNYTLKKHMPLCAHMHAHARTHTHKTVYPAQDIFQQTSEKRTS
jgi:hypothetical protein